VLLLSHRETPTTPEFNKMKNLKSYSEEELVAEYDRLSALICKTPRFMRRNVCPTATTNKQVIADEMRIRRRREFS
jgi:hypothetical protein